MKKSLTLALALSLSLAGTAFAANPFSDLPANHWAYQSVAKLAQAGIIEGYGDDTFRGTRNITRYEMAQMVAKAMTKVDAADASQKAQIEKLAAEFSTELNNLGVRVNKLEKNADKVAITGDMRLQYKHRSLSYKDNAKPKYNQNETLLRTRIYLTGEINDDFKAVTMLENFQNLQTNGRTNEDKTSVARAFVKGNINDIEITAGRFDYIPVFGVFFDGDMDGVQVKFGNKLKTTLSYGRMDSVWPTTEKVDTLSAELAYMATDKLAFKGAFHALDGKTSQAHTLPLQDSNVYELAANYRFNKNIGIWAEFMGTDQNVNNSGKKGFVASLYYKGMDVSKKGSWGAYIVGANVPAGVLLYPTFDLALNRAAFGIKAVEVGVDYALMRNVRWHTAYIHNQDKVHNPENEKSDMLYSYLQFFF